MVENRTKKFQKVEKPNCEITNDENIERKNFDYRIFKQKNF